ncbi:hypothetical protein [Brevibacillus sp. HD1.4A]|uniref:hypothetical protein n=1 Tax=Brevibacillus sp. HD1.4A TaxID=2738978 RepID=UPI00156B89AD|nr:hypothetical protein [Brevibacillus sp. HD1.4A]NRQ53429.1 hypothetical protein [Brevibacillus sp. HD1.4A]
MNKKVVLSVLATAVVASMAASAFAAPKQGLYIGGNVKKFYSTSTLLNMTKDARTAYKNELKTAGFQNLVFVNIKGQGATIKEMIDLGTKVALADPLKQSDFLDSYGVVQNDGTVNGTEVPKVDPVPTGDLKVDSVTAVNPITVEVKFNNEVKADTAVASANYLINGVAFPGGTTYTLQDDKKTVVISLPVANKLNSGSTFLVTVQNVLDLNQKPVEAFNKAVSFSDTTAPTLGPVSYPDNNTAKVSFSEPMTSITAASVKVYDETGADVTAANLGLKSTVAAGGKDLLIDLTGAAVNKTYTVKVFGALDLSSNAAGTKTFTVVKTVSDVIKPTVTAITPVALDTFKITFSEKVIIDPNTASNGYGSFTVTPATGAPVTGQLINGGNVTSVTLNADGNELTVKLAAPVAAGVGSVTVNNYFDASSNEQTTAFTKVVNFAGDTTAPVVSSATVANIAGVDNLLVKFDDADIQLGNAVGNIITGGKRVVDGVEYTVTAFGTATLHDPDGDGKADTVAIPLTGQPAGSYTVTLAAGVAADKVGASAGASNNSIQTTISFTYNTSTNTEKPAVVDNDNNKANGASSVVLQSTAAPNEITISFNKEVTNATALNVANYLVDNEAVFEKATFVNDKKTVKLTLKPDTIKATTSYSFEIKNVADANGIVMDPVTFVQPFTENVAPFIKTAALSAPNTVQLTFSENMTDASLTDNDDLELWVGGVKVTSGIASVAGSNDAYTVTLANPISATDLAKDIQIKVLNTNNAKDASPIQNALKGDVTVTVTK